MSQISQGAPSIREQIRGARKARNRPKGRALDSIALAAVQELLGDVPLRRDLLIEHLHKIQDRYHCLSAAHLRALAELMNLPQAEVWETATFYAHFDPILEDETPPPPVTIRVCDSLSCTLQGAEELLAELSAKCDPSTVRVVRAPCMGRCDTAPTVEVGHRHLDQVHPGTDAVAAVMEVTTNESTAPIIPQYESLTDYQAGGGYQVLAELQKGERSPDAVQEQLLAAGLRGLGGAGFPSGRKWGFVRAEPAPRYLAINADEGEPGTFKDRYLLEHSPHMFLEGALIAAWAVEAERIFLYLRDEYPAVRHVLEEEIQRLEHTGIVAPGVFDLRRGGRSLHLRRGIRNDRIDRGQARIAPASPPVRCPSGNLRSPDVGAQRGNIVVGHENRT